MIDLWVIFKNKKNAWHIFLDTNKNPRMWSRAVFRDKAQARISVYQPWKMLAFLCELYKWSKQLSGLISFCFCRLYGLHCS